jgi:hypothetical protein
MGIQAFTPVLVPGFAVHLHPLVCPPFNADFDGDTMAIHLPMSHVARAEAHVLLSGSLFPVSPSSGDGSLLPSQDIVLGCFALTQLQGDDPLEKLGVGLFTASNFNSRIRNGNDCDIYKWLDYLDCPTSRRSKTWSSKRTPCSTGRYLSNHLSVL